MSKPRNSLEFMRLTKTERGEGVVIAVFPPKITDLRQDGDALYLTQWERGQFIMGNLGGDLGVRVIDIMPDPPEVRVKWWKVRDHAAGTGYGLVPVAWEGAAEDIPEKYFEPGLFAGFRLYSTGPWVWPVDRPEMVLAKDPEEIILTQAVKGQA